jgi:type I restriction enzyme S subunit
MLGRIKIGDLIKQKKAHSQTGPFGTQLSASDYVAEGTPVINVRNIGFGDIRTESLEYVDQEMANQLKNHRLQKNDIVFGRKGAVERHSLISSNEDGWIQGSDCIRLRFLTEEYDAVFISYFFRTEYHKQWMMNLGSFGATMSSLNQEIVSKIEIPNIPVPIQRTIASILSVYDNLIENNKQLIRLLEQMAEENYKEWFVRMRFPGYETAKFVDGLPEGWKEVRLKECFEYYIGGGWGEDYPNGSSCKPAYVIRGTDIPDARIGCLNFEVLRFHSASNLFSRKLKVNDIVFEVSGGTESQSLGRTLLISQTLLGRFDKDLICASFCKLIRIKQKMVSALLIYQFLNRLYNTGEIMLFQVQSTGISNYKFEGFIDNQKFRVPSFEIQIQFDKNIQPILDQIQLLGAKNQLLKQTRDLLLPRLISGKLSVEYLLQQAEEELSMKVEPEDPYNR